MIQTALLVTLLVAASLATSNNNGFNNKQYCRLPGTFTPANTETIDTFNKVSATAAANALCSKLTATALRADAADCVVFTEGSKVGVKVAVTEGTNHYECRAYVDNDSQCRGNSGGGNGHKRQTTATYDCSVRNTTGECLAGCFGSDPLNDNCDCWWDPPGSPGFPLENVIDPCPEGQQCCFNKPCQSYLDATDCYFLSGGAIDELTGTDSRCTWDPSEAMCVCRNPLEPLPVPASYPVELPIDCICPFSNSTTVTAEQCAALLTPTEQQERELFFLSNRVFVTAKQLYSQSFVSQCPRDRVRVFFSFGPRVHAILTKVKSRLRQQTVSFLTQYHSNFVDFFFSPNQGGRFRAIAEEELSKEELEALSPSSLEYEDAKTDDQTTVALSAAALTAAAVAGAI